MRSHQNFTDPEILDDKSTPTGICIRIGQERKAVLLAFGLVFTGEEIRLLQALANQAAIAIKRTTLIEKSHELQDALPVLKLMERDKVSDALEEID